MSMASRGVVRHTSHNPMANPSPSMPSSTASVPDHLRPMHRHACGRDPLQEAARQGRIDDVRMALAAGCDPRRKDDHGCTAMHHAAGSKHGVVCLEILLGLGVDHRAADHEGWTPAHYAAIHGRLDNLRMLIAAGVDPHAVTTEDMTIADSAGQSGSATVLQATIAAGCDPDRKTRKDMTPIIAMALSTESDARIRMALDASRDPWAVGPQGRDAPSIAVVDKRLHAGVAGSRIDPIGVAVRIDADEGDLIMLADLYAATPSSPGRRTDVAAWILRVRASPPDARRWDAAVPDGMDACHDAIMAHVAAVVDRPYAMRLMAAVSTGA